MRIPQTMMAIRIREPGPPAVLEPVQYPVPEMAATEVLIRVFAAGVNRPDVLQRQGHYPPPAGASSIPGLEVAGEIAAVFDVVQSRTVEIGTPADQQRHGLRDRLERFATGFARRQF